MARQIKILDAMRFSLEIVDYNHNSLIQELTEISLNEKKKNIPVLMNHAWALIDFTQRFHSLYKKLATEINNDIDCLNNWAFRNACQHFTSNLEKVIEDENQLFGALKWAVKDEKNAKVFSCLAVSGISAVFHGMKHTVLNASFKEYDSVINDIRLEITIFDKKEKRKELNLSELMLELETVVRRLEDNLKLFCTNNKLRPTNWSHRKDIMIKLIPEIE